MVKLICQMNRIDWIGNEGETVRRGDMFEMGDQNQVDIWLREGYVSLAGASDEVPITQFDASDPFDIVPEPGEAELFGDEPVGQGKGPELDKPVPLDSSLKSTLKRRREKTAKTKTE